MLKNRYLNLWFFFAGALILLLCCNMGGSTEQGNARITGSISGGAANDSIVEVQLVADGYNPFDFGSGYVFATTTLSGRYNFVDIPFGTYYLYAFDYGHRYTLLDGPFTIEKQDWNTGKRQLEKAAVVSILNKTTDGGTLFYVNGTSHAVIAAGAANGVCQLTGVPPGQHTIMQTDTLLGASVKSAPFVNITITPGDTVSVSRNNTGPHIRASGAQLPSELHVDSLYHLSFIASDPENDTIRFGVVPALVDGLIDQVTGSFTWKPSASEISIRRLTFRAVDQQGAFDEIVVPVYIVQPSQPPQPQQPTGNSTVLLTTAEKFSSLPAGCQTGVSLFRFSFGNGDTSAWIDVPEISYQWTTTGTFNVAVQVKCADYPAPSPWSVPFAVSVNKSSPTAVPELKLDKTEAVLGDTVIAYAAGKGCDSTALFDFFVKDPKGSGWIKSSTYMFVPPGAGEYDIIVRSWCDTAISEPSEYSLPQRLRVLDSILPLPTLKGPISYTPADTFRCQFYITSEQTFNGHQLEHRFRISTKNELDSTKPVASMLINYTCTESSDCRDTIPMLTSDTTGWCAGYQFDVLLLQPKTYSYVVLVQARDRATLRVSTWNSFTILPPE